MQQGFIFVVLVLLVAVGLASYTQQTGYIVHSERSSDQGTGNLVILGLDSL